MPLRRWEIRRRIQETHPFKLATFITVLIEYMLEKGILTDQRFLDMLAETSAMTDQIHYE